MLRAPRPRRGSTELPGDKPHHSVEYHRREGANLVVGVEDGFTGARYIRRRFAQDCPRVPLCTSLEETCAAALALARERAARVA